MTLADVMNIDFPEQFGTFEKDEEVGSIEEVYAQIDASTTTALGASKFIIFLNDYEVAKIPFNGYWTERWNAEADEYDEDLVFEYYNTTDYCAIEADIYKKAVSAGVECFFAETRFEGRTFSHTPIYVSERVYSWEDREKEELCVPSEDSMRKAEEQKYSRLPRKWIAKAYEMYDEELVDNFLSFVEEENISDLHRGNLGYRADGSPCILDYSGFDW